MDASLSGPRDSCSNIRCQRFKLTQPAFQPIKENSGRSFRLHLRGIAFVLLWLLCSEKLRAQNVDHCFSDAPNLPSHIKFLLDSEIPKEKMSAALIESCMDYEISDKWWLTGRSGSYLVR
jgi:hypothetical protein